MGRKGGAAVIGVTVLALGKLKERYMRDFCAEYEKRLSAFCRLQVVELAPERLPENPSAGEISRALQREAEKIRAKIPPNAYVFAMCIEGGQMNSVQFSQKITSAAVEGYSNLVFVLGSSFGLSETVKQAAKERFSMSAMTFPHQLARVMLLEQLYRAFQIAAGGKYHK